MKKIFKYICLVGLIGMMSSCVDESLFSQDAIDSGDGIKLTMSLSLPQMQTMETRSVLDNEVLNPHNPTSDYLKSLNLYMFIFENTGSPESNYLLTLVHGDRINADTGGDPLHQGQTLQTFTATVEGTSENAIIHLVATADPNFEDQLQNATDRTELGLFYGSNGLYTRNQYPAFWKRIDLGMPITKENATTEDFKQKLNHVQMIRNFCRVTVGMDEKYDNPNQFVIDGYALVNQVNAAYVAAYSDNEPRGFVEFEASDNSGNLTGKMKSYGDILEKDKYTPARHPESVRDHKEEDASNWLPAEGNDDSNIFSNTPKYMFERPYQSQHRTFVIIKGHFGNSKEYRYIKLDIGDIPEWLFDETEGFLSSAFEYRHLYRNFSYNINITTIASKSVGAATAAGAVSGPAVNNVGATVETQSITDISDGVDRMFVNETKFVIVDDDEGNPYPASADLMWRYVSDWQRAKTNDTQYIKYNYPGMELLPNDDSGIFGSLTEIANGAQWPDGWESDTYGNWSGMKIAFNTPDETVRQKTVRLYYANPSNAKPNVRLSRDVIFIMRKRWEFVTDDSYPSNIEVYPGAYSYENNTMPYESLKEMRDNITPGYVGSQRGAQLTVMFELPDDLPESLFPLDFKIGFDRQNVENAYVGNAIVTTGPSMFEDDPEGVGVPRMQFIKTVTWDYYHGSGDAGDKGHKIVTARFVTTNNVLAESGFTGNASTTRVRVTNPYFKLGSDSFDRNAHDDDLDPTRMHWIWNFTYPEWTIYVSNHTGHEAGDLDDLYFSNYQWGTFSSHGNYMAIGNGAVAGDGSADNPAFWFEVNTDMSQSSNGYTATMTMKTSQDTESYRKGLDWYWYPRRIYVRISYTDGTNTEQSFANSTQDTNGWTGKGDLAKTLQENTLTFDVPVNKQIKDVKIWSVREGDSQYRIQGLTRYYWIDFTLSPK